MPNLAEATAYLLLRPLLPNFTPLSLPEVTTKIVMGVVITKKQNLHLVLIIIVDEYIMIMLSLRGPWENALIVPSLSTSPRLH